jgi:gamma-glutamylcyclotransferase (GGCT)/AIG2-like uncharacterized protein YtfP
VDDHRVFMGELRYAVPQDSCMPGPAPSDAPVPSDSGFIFVYGALMRGCDLHGHMAGATFISPATSRGKLYDAGSYPGMIEGDGTVHGELYRFDDAAVVLEVLDEIEEYDPLDTAGSLYVRVVRQVRLDEKGSEAPAWLYLYNRDVKGMPQIRSGDWRRR